MDIDREIERVKAMIAAREAADMQSLVAQIAIKRAKEGTGTYEQAEAELDRMQALIENLSKLGKKS